MTRLSIESQPSDTPPCILNIRRLSLPLIVTLNCRSRVRCGVASYLNWSPNRAGRQGRQGACSSVYNHICKPPVMTPVILRHDTVRITAGKTADQLMQKTRLRLYKRLDSLRVGSCIPLNPLLHLPTCFPAIHPDFLEVHREFMQATRICCP